MGAEFKAKGVHVALGTKRTAFRWKILINVVHTYRSYDVTLRPRVFSILPTLLYYRNMVRVPAAGRNWEGFGADPFLAGEAAYVICCLDLTHGIDGQVFILPSQLCHRPRDAVLRGPSLVKFSSLLSVRRRRLTGDG
jgi:hypothetical protein